MFGCIFLHNAVKHWQEAEDQVNKMARFDALTGLPNRYLINEILERVILDAEKMKRNLPFYLWISIILSGLTIPLGTRQVISYYKSSQAD